MGPLLPALAAGGASIMGSVVSGMFARKSAKDQMAFQKEMSSTAHQREVADLRAAGLNPIISAMGGSGASTPSGAGYEVPDVGAGVGQAVTTAMDMRRLKNEIQESKTRQWQNEADYQNKLRLYDYIGEQIKTERATARRTAAEATQEEIMAEFVRQNPKLAPIMDKIIGRSGGIISSAIGLLKKGRK